MLEPESNDPFLLQELDLTSKEFPQHLLVQSTPQIIATSKIDHEVESILSIIETKSHTQQLHQRQQLLDFLQSFSYIKNLIIQHENDPQTMNPLLSHLKVISYQANQVILTKGFRNNNVFILLKGKAGKYTSKSRDALQTERQLQASLLRLKTILKNEGILDPSIYEMPTQEILKIQRNIAAISKQLAELKLQDTFTFRQSGFYEFTEDGSKISQHSLKQILQGLVDVFGYQNILSHSKMEYSVITHTDCTAIEIPGTRFFEVFYKEQENQKFFLNSIRSSFQQINIDFLLAISHQVTSLFFEKSASINQQTEKMVFIIKSGTVIVKDMQFKELCAFGSGSIFGPIHQGPTGSNLNFICESSRLHILAVSKNHFENNPSGDAFWIKLNEITQKRIQFFTQRKQEIGINDSSPQHDKIIEQRSVSVKRTQNQRMSQLIASFNSEAKKKKLNVSEVCQIITESSDKNADPIEQDQQSIMMRSCFKQGQKVSLSQNLSNRKVNIKTLMKSVLLLRPKKGTASEGVSNLKTKGGSASTKQKQPSIEQYPSQQQQPLQSKSLQINQEFLSENRSKAIQLSIQQIPEKTDPSPSINKKMMITPSLKFSFLDETRLQDTSESRNGSPIKRNQSPIQDLQSQYEQYYVQSSQLELNLESLEESESPKNTSPKKERIFQRLNLQNDNQLNLESSPQKLRSSIGVLKSPDKQTLQSKCPIVVNNMQPQPSKFIYDPTGGNLQESKIKQQSDSIFMNNTDKTTTQSKQPMKNSKQLTRGSPVLDNYSQSQNKSEDDDDDDDLCTKSIMVDKTTSISSSDPYSNYSGLIEKMEFVSRLNKKLVTQKQKNLIKHETQLQKSFSQLLLNSSKSLKSSNYIKEGMKNANKQKQVSSLVNKLNWFMEEQSLHPLLSVSPKPDELKEQADPTFHLDSVLKSPNSQSQSRFKVNPSTYRIKTQEDYMNNSFLKNIGNSSISSPSMFSTTTNTNHSSIGCFFNPKATINLRCSQYSTKTENNKISNTNDPQILNGSSQTTRSRRSSARLRVREGEERPQSSKLNQSSSIKNLSISRINASPVLTTQKSLPKFLHFQPKQTQHQSEGFLRSNFKFFS